MENSNEQKSVDECYDILFEKAIEYSMDDWRDLHKVFSMKFLKLDIKEYRKALKNKKYTSKMPKELLIIIKNNPAGHYFKIKSPSEYYHYNSLDLSLDNWNMDHDEIILRNRKQKLYITLLSSTPKEKLDDIASIYANFISSKTEHNVNFHIIKNLKTNEYDVLIRCVVENARERTKLFNEFIELKSLSKEDKKLFSRDNFITPKYVKKPTLLSKYHHSYKKTKLNTLIKSTKPDVNKIIKLIKESLYITSKMFDSCEIIDVGNIKPISNNLCNSDKFIETPIILNYQSEDNMVSLTPKLEYGHNSINININIAPENSQTKALPEVIHKCISSKENKVETTPVYSGAIYIIWEREFITLSQPIYKIGKTKQKGLKRFNAYPKFSSLMSILQSEDITRDERYLVNLFKGKYTQRRDIGREYFEGNIIEMIEDIERYLKVNKKAETPYYEKSVLCKSRTEYINDFVKHIKNDKPRWYRPGEFVPKWKMLEEFHEYVNDSVHLKSVKPHFTNVLFRVDKSAVTDYLRNGKNNHSCIICLSFDEIPDL